MILQAMESGTISEDAIKVYNRATAEHDGECPRIGLCQIAIA